MKRMSAVLVQANINIIGLRPGEQAEVEDTTLTRGLVQAQYLTLLRKKKAPKAEPVEPVAAPSGEAE